MEEMQKPEKPIDEVSNPPSGFNKDDILHSLKPLGKKVNQVTFHKTSEAISLINKEELLWETQ